MNRESGRNLFKGHGVAHQGLRHVTREDLLPDGEPLRSEDITLFTILVVEQGDSTGPVGIVFDGGDLRWHTHLLPLEVDQPVLRLMPTSAMTAGDPTLVITATGLLDLNDQRLLRSRSRNLGEIRDASEPASGTGWLV